MLTQHFLKLWKVISQQQTTESYQRNIVSCPIMYIYLMTFFEIRTFLLFGTIDNVIARIESISRSCAHL
jgi:hypothetical protein